jgi:photosynthetic reaction center cytochrome c subunit
MPTRLTVAAVLLLAPAVAAQTTHKFPPDSLVNVKVIPRETPVLQLIGTMRNFTSYLGVRCPFCHVGEEGRPLAEFDFPSDEKRTKQVARQMIRMVDEINRRLDTIPGRTAPGLQVTCGTCHRGVSRPVPLSSLIEEVAGSAGADSAVRAYRALRQRYYGSDAYNFGEGSLNTAAFRLGRAGRFAEAFQLLGLNEELFPGSSGMYVFRGNISLMQGDTTAAAKAYREALRRDPANEEAKGRLRNIGQQP